jgi:DinB superfamily
MLGSVMATARQIPVSTWPAQLAAEISANDQSARTLMDGLTEEQLNWQPDPGSWSVGQCLEHLCMTNEAYLPAIAVALHGQPDAPAENITPGWFGRWFIRKFVEPSAQSKPVGAPAKIRPNQRVDLSVLDRLVSTNEACREVIDKAGSKNVNRIRFRNPFFPLVHFTVGTGLQIIASHERRHLLQAKRVRESVSFPKETSRVR